MNKLFVYGSLLQGELRHGVLEGSRRLGPVLARASLRDLGSYPALLGGSGTVVGELYAVDARTLAQIDRIEGYDPDHPDDSLYRRVTLPIRHLADGRRETVLAYRYNHPPAGRRIGHGDYRRWRLEQQSEAQWVLAYGSNLCPDRLAARVGEPLAFERGSIPGFELRFNKHAQGGGAVCANIGWVGGSAACPAVAWKLTREQVETLDSYEGTPDHYLRMTLPFEGEQAGCRLCQVFVAQPDHIEHALQPADAYVTHIRRGYEFHGFGAAALGRLEALLDAAAQPAPSRSG